MDRRVSGYPEAVDPTAANRGESVAGGLPRPRTTPLQAALGPPISVRRPPAWNAASACFTAALFSECPVLGGEGALGAGLVQGLGAVQCPGLAQQHLQVAVQDQVFQDQVFQTAVGEPGMAGNLTSVVERDERVASQVDSDLAVDEADVCCPQEREIRWTTRPE